MRGGAELEVTCDFTTGRGYTLATGRTVGADAGMILGAGDDEAEALPLGGAASGPVTLAERMARLGQRPAAIVLLGGDAARRGELGSALERRLWDEGYTAHVLPPRSASSLKLSASLGLLGILLADGDVELSGVRAAVGGDALLEVSCDEGSPEASVESILHHLRERGVIR